MFGPCGKLACRRCAVRRGMTDDMPDCTDQRLSISHSESDVTDQRGRMCLGGVWIALISLMFVAFSLSSAGPLLRKDMADDFMAGSGQQNFASSRLRPLEQCPMGSVAAAALGGVAKGLRACVAAAGFAGANGGPFYACPLHSFKTVVGDAPCSQCARWGRTRCLGATSIQQCVAGACTLMFLIFGRAISLG